ncbi:MAG: glycerate kinase [Conexivisphaerales archaeon]
MRSGDSSFFTELVLQVLRDTDPVKLVRSSVKRRGDLLEVRDILKGEILTYRLSRFRRVVILGGGKASGKMAKALEEILGKYLQAGVVNILPQQKFSSSRLRFFHSGHPYTTAGTIKGMKEMLKLAGNPTKDDLFIIAISGGGSAMMELPADGITLRDSVKLTKLLLESGADIHEINSVRKHISQVKGGLLAKRLYPATIISLIISDVVGNQLDAIASGPTAPDNSTFKDAKNCLVRYGIWNIIPSSVRERIEKGVRGQLEENPKHGDIWFENVKNVVIGSNSLALNSARKFLLRHGFQVNVITDRLTGEAGVEGSRFALMLKQTKVSDSKRIAMIAGGETTVTIKGKHGKGGRNQEFVLASSINLEGSSGLSVISFATDGVDGPTEAAGALADSLTVRKAKEMGIDARNYLLMHDSFSFFKKVGGLIITGPTGTNVNDVAIGVKVSD